MVRIRHLYATCIATLKDDEDDMHYAYTTRDWEHELMTTETNKQLVRTFMRLLSEGKFEQAASCLREDMQWRIVSTSSPAVLTRAQIIGAAKAMIAASTDGQFSMSPVGMVAEGDNVAVEAESHMNLKDGKTYNNKYHMLWMVRDDKVIECREYGDTAHAVDVLNNVLAAVMIPE
jgi:uncharacterized protein